MSIARALVLGGGGVLGISWETGVLAGLAGEGVEVTDAELIVGTSAGATVAAQVSTGAVQGLYRAQIDQTAAREPKLDVDLPAILKQIGDIVAHRQSDPEAARREIGRIALECDRVPESERRALIGERLSVHDWPERRLAVPAIEARTGRFTVFDRESGVGLVEAVAASSAIPLIWPAVTIGSERFYDGGIRSATNVDVARHARRRLILAPLRMTDMADCIPQADDQDDLWIEPDERSSMVIGADPMNPDFRPAAARAGFAQGVRTAEVVRSFWNDGT